MIWKQRLGSSATYKKLIGIFESSGYSSYADEVRKIAGVEDDESNESSDDDETVIQHQTYPPVKRHMSLDIPSPAPTSQERFILIKPDAAQHLPKCKMTQFSQYDGFAPYYDDVNVLLPSIVLPSSLMLVTVTI